MPAMLSDRPDKQFESLIPELREWNGGRGIDVDSWISCVGSYEHAIGYSRLFWPEFVLHDGCLLSAGFSAESYRGFMERANGNRRAVEAVMNHTHIVDLFCDPAAEPTVGQILHMGRILGEMWHAKLCRDFPDLDVVVSFPEDPQDDLLDYEITVYQAG